MKRKKALVLFITILLLIVFTVGCDEEVNGFDEISNPDMLEGFQLFFEDAKMMLKRFYTQRIKRGNQVWF